jgi:TfoX/Sxy family transcriptional regulator of competence genes
MTDDKKLAEDVRSALAGAGDIREIRMFGGIGFMLNGNMVAAASRRGLLLRVGKDREDEALAQSGARPMVMRGRRMEGYVYIDAPVLSRQAVQNGMRLAVPYVQALPPKTARRSEEKKTRNKKRKQK